MSVSQVTVLVLMLVVAPVVVLVMCRPSAIERRGRNAWVGIRLPSTAASDEAWVAGHRAAWPAVRGGCLAAVGLGLGVLVLAPAVPLTEDAVGAASVAGTTVWTALLVVGARRASTAATAVTEAAR